MTQAHFDTDSLIRAIPQASVIVGPGERILAANEPAFKLFGPECVGRHYITALRQPALLDAIEAVFRGADHKVTRYLGRETDHDTAYSVTVAMVLINGGRGVMMTFEDQTAIESAEKMRRDFVANVSHELKTPLTAMLGFLETLRGPAKDDANARDRFLNIMQSEAERMSSLVNDLLSLSKVEEKERIRPMETVDLIEVITTTIRALGPVADAAHVMLQADFKTQKVSLQADERQLQQVLSNLISNAIKYGASGGRVDVTVTAEPYVSQIRGRGVRIDVRDYGEGIEEHHIPRLTERFYRVDTHRSREVGGTGLGLAIVKHIVNRHRGRLRVASRPGEGATFTVILPLD